MNRQTKQSFYKKTQSINGGCVIYTGAISPYGYGKVGYNGKVMLAHRLAYIFEYGGIPEGLFVCHKCDNRKCVNPDHLFLGSAMDNYLDMVRKNRKVNRGKNRNKKTCKH
jgi:hypothetical protein